MDRLKWLFRAWRYRLKLERQEIRVLLNHLRPGDTAIDVGAHKGGYTYWMRSRVGKRGRVIAFEPQPVLAQRLQRLINTSGFKNVTVESQGVSSTSDTLTLRVPGTRTSPGASFESGVVQGGQSIAIPVTPLDDYAAAHGITQLRMIKCDAEGHELEVFKGAEGVLTRLRPLLLFECEVRHRASGRVDDVFDYLQGLGYQGQALARQGPLSLDQFDPERHQASPDQPDYINNFVFRPTEAQG
ncbi:MAG: FkbM family methyltransferase [Planctomycetota bacterium]|nr:FkbM family methyltransferase [Planctomycetota bacterium]